MKNFKINTAIGEISVMANSEEGAQSIVQKILARRNVTIVNPVVVDDPDDIVVSIEPLYPVDDVPDIVPDEESVYFSDESVNLINDQEEEV